MISCSVSPGEEGGLAVSLPYSRDCFHFLLLGIWACAVQHLEEVRCFCLHAYMNIGLRALDVVVQVVLECVYQVDGVV